MTKTAYTDSGISPRTTLYAAAEMLAYAGPVMVLDKFGLNKPMPQNKTQTIKFRRPVVFSAATAPLMEGVTPDTTQFSYEDVSVSLKQYGMLVEITDVIEDTHEDPVLRDATRQCADNIARTMEALRYGILRAGTNVYYANGSARTDVNTPVSLDKLRKVVRGLKANKAKMITSILSGSTDFATKPVEAAYVAVCHTDCESDIRNLPSFVPVSQYGSRKPIHEMELGSVEGIRFIVSPDLEAFADGGGAKGSMYSTTGTSADVYPILVFGQEAYGSVPLKGKSAVSPTIIPVGQKDKSDPLGQRGYVGWKTWFACLILNQLWMARLEVAVTAL